MTITNTSSDTVDGFTGILGYDTSDVVTVADGTITQGSTDTDAYRSATIDAGDEDNVALVELQAGGTADDQKVKLESGDTISLVFVIPHSESIKFGESYTLTVTGTVGTAEFTDSTVVYVTTGF